MTCTTNKITKVALSCLLVVVVSVCSGGNSYGVEAVDQLPEVTCGSTVKFTHAESSSPDGGTSYFLNSEQKNLGGGSGQQIVTMVSDKSTSATMWWIREANDAEQSCDPGTPIACGTQIRMTHLDTLRNLHSHDVPSPLSRQQEVSGYGEKGVGDNGDNWKVVCNGGGKYWHRGEKVRFLHMDTQKYLGGSSSVKFDQRNCGGNCPIMDHLEAFGRKGVDSFSEFFVELGVHISK